MVCMITVYAYELSTEYNTPLINKNIAGILLIIGFSGWKLWFYLEIKDNQLIFQTGGYLVSVKYYFVSR